MARSGHARGRFNAPRTAKGRFAKGSSKARKSTKKSTKSTKSTTRKSSKKLCPCRNRNKLGQYTR